jgi:hypothetical protein
MANIDSSAVRAVACRRLGSLPLCLALGAADIGEAKLEDGRRVIITWGANVDAAGQFWHAHNSRFQPVWVGSSDGACELILGEDGESSDELEWMWAGLRITQADGPEWTPVTGGE